MGKGTYQDAVAAVADSTERSSSGKTLQARTSAPSGPLNGSPQVGTNATNATPNLPHIAEKMVEILDCKEYYNNLANVNLNKAYIS